MAKEYLDKDGLLYFWQKIKNLFAVKSDAIKNITRNGTTFTATKADGTTFTFTQQDNNTTYSDFTGATSLTTAGAQGLVPAPSGTTYTAPKSYVLLADGTWDLVDTAIIESLNSDGDSGGYLKISNAGVLSTDSGNLMTDAQQTKLNGIATGAEVNQNAFSNIKIDGTTIAADGKTDTFTIVSGSNITLTPDSTNDKVTIATSYRNYGTTLETPAAGMVPAPASSYGYNWVLTARGGWTEIGGVLESGAAGDNTGYLFLGGEDGDELYCKAGNTANSVCVLNSNGKIDATYLPSYVDDVIEAYALSGQTALSSTWLSTTSGGSALTPETGKIYVLMADSGDYAANTQFRWSGSAYVKLADGGVSSITNAEIDTIVAS